MSFDNDNKSYNKYNSDGEQRPHRPRVGSYNREGGERPYRSSYGNRGNVNVRNALVSTRTRKVVNSVLIVRV